MTSPAPGGWTPPPGWVPTPQGWVPPEAVGAAPPAATAPAAATAPPAATAPVEIVPHEPVEYHRLLRTLPRYRAWKPAVAIVVAAAYFFVLSLIVGAILFVVAIATGAFRTDTVEHLNEDINSLLEIDAASPISLLFALTSIAVMLPAVILAMATVGLRPSSAVHSVAFRLRGRWLLLSTVPALAILALNLGIGLLLSGLTTGEWLLAPTTDLTTFVICAVIIVLLTPVQAAAEEYVFRGLLMQAIGAWIKFLPLALIVPTLLFASLHVYDIWGLLDVAIFGIAAAIVVWRTGGLEAAISMHTVNNVTSFLLLASGVFGTTVNEAETGGPIGPAISVVTMSLWVLWISWLAKRQGIARLGAWAPRALRPARDAGNGGVVPPPAA